MLGYQVVRHTLGEGRRIRPQPNATTAWRPRPFWDRRNHTIYMEGVRPQPEQVRHMARWQEAERGSWGIAVLVRPEFPIEATRLVHMRVLPADRVRRVALGARHHGGGKEHLGGGHPHVAPRLRVAPQLGRAATPAAHGGPPRRGAGRGHEQLGPADAPVHAGLAASVEGSHLARVAAAQPDRSHPRARRPATRQRRGAPRRRFRPPADTRPSCRSARLPTSRARPAGEDRRRRATPMPDSSMRRPWGVTLLLALGFGTAACSSGAPARGAGDDQQHDTGGAQGPRPDVLHHEDNGRPDLDLDDPRRRAHSRRSG